jgi:hypothetical protein
MPLFHFDEEIQILFCKHAFLIWWGNAHFAFKYAFFVLTRKFKFCFANTVFILIKNFKICLQISFFYFDGEIQFLFCTYAFISFWWRNLNFFANMLFYFDEDI